MNDPLDVAVIGGGAAGFFGALACAEARTGLRIAVLERTSRCLAKVAISGGGRCNVTHACEDPQDLAQHYPRGGQALRGAFSRFAPAETVAWFESRGVALKTESDGRMFPTTDQSQTVIDCFKSETLRLGLKVTTNVRIQTIRQSDAGFVLAWETGEERLARRVLLATGSNPQGWEWARALGHTLQPAAPSLFTFQIEDPRLKGLSGVAVPKVRLTLESPHLYQEGALLITHWGTSGPATLKLSAWGARALQKTLYRTALSVDWTGGQTLDTLHRVFASRRAAAGKKTVHADAQFQIPRRLWERLCQAADIPATMRWTELSNERAAAFSRELLSGRFQISGKGVFKDEFVTCGGVTLDEVDFRTMESKRCPGLYFAGEVLDIDGVTGGFNFQSAWTTGWTAGTAIAKSLKD